MRLTRLVAVTALAIAVLGLPVLVPSTASAQVS
jgi:hypothetical protein